MDTNHPQGPPIRAVLVDDVEEVRALVRIRLELDGRVEVVGEAGDGMTAAAVVAETRPDVVVLDLDMPEMDGLRAIPVMRAASPASRVLVLSAFPDPYTLVDVLARGADSYLDQGAALAELVPTLVTLCDRVADSADCA